MVFSKKQKGYRPSDTFLICISCVIICLILLTSFTIITVMKIDTDKREDLHQNVAAKFERNIVEVKNGTNRGSGVIVENKDGKLFVVTNFHVIKLHRSISIDLKFYNNSEFTSGARVMGFDTLYDIAVLSLEHELPFATEDIFGAMQVDFTPKMGENVLGLGNALGKGVAAVDGIVSKHDKVLQPNDIDFPVPLIQTTAPLNSGNSGGGLFNLDGELIGINGYHTWTFNGEPVDGISYAIPVNIVYSLYKTAVKLNGGDTINVPNSRLGESSEGSYYIQSGMDFNLKFTDGKLLVSSVSASLGGNLKKGDEIISIGSIAVEPYGYSAIIAELLSYRADNKGEQFVIKFLRNGVSLEMKLDKYKI